MPEISHLVLLALMLMVTGAVTGVLAGLLGVGGGIILVQSFYYVFSAMGYDGPQLMQVCLATSLATIIVTSARSVLSHNKKGAVDWQVLRSWAPGIAVGAIVGVLVVAQLRSVVLQGIFGVVGMIIGLYMGLGRSHWRVGEAMPTGALRVVLSAMIGFLSVLMGIGGGAFGVPLMRLHGVPIHRAVATAAGFGGLIALPSAIGFLFVHIPAAQRPPLTVGAVNFGAFGLVVMMTVLTAPIGVRLAHRLDPKPLKRIFAVFLVMVALNMVRKAFFS